MISIAFAESEDLSQYSTAELRNLIVDLQNEIAMRNTEEEKKILVLDAFLDEMSNNGHSVECDRDIRDRVATIYDAEVSPEEYSLHFAGGFVLVLPPELPTEYVRDCATALMLAICRFEGTSSFDTLSTAQDFYDKHFATLTPGVTLRADKGGYRVSIEYSTLQGNPSLFISI